MKLEVGDHIFYGIEKDDNYEDVIETSLNKKNKPIFYGKYLKNGAHSDELTSLEELLKYYEDNWEKVYILRKGEKIIVKTFEEEIKKGYINFERKISEELTIKLIRLNNKVYYTEYVNNTLTYWKRTYL